MELETILVLIIACMCFVSSSDVYNISFFASTTKGYRGKYYAGAFFLAVDHVNNDSVLPNASLGYFFHDTRQDNLRVIRDMTYDFFNGTLAFIGPDDKCDKEATVAGAWNKPMIAYSCLGLSSAGPNAPTFARTQPSFSKVSRSIISLLKHYKWTSYTAIIGQPVHNDTYKKLRRLSRHNGIHIRAVKYFKEPYSSTNKKSKVRPVMPDIVEDTYKNTRIYVFIGDYDALIDFMRALQDKGVTDTGNYAVISVEERRTKFGHKDLYFVRPIEDGNITQKKIDAFRPLLLLSPRQPSSKAKWEEFRINVLQRDYRQPINLPRPYAALKNMTWNAQIPINAAYLYDAVKLIARALKEVLIEKGNVANGSEIYRRIIKRQYPSILGYDMYIDKDGDSVENYTVLSLQKKNGWLHSMRPSGYFLRVNNTSDYDMIFQVNRTIYWPGGEAPASEPPCGFTGEKCPELGPDWKIPIICLVIIIAALGLVFLIGRHYLYEQKLARLLWKIDKKDLMFVDTVEDIIPPARPKRRSTNRWKYMFLGDTDEPSVPVKPRTSKPISIGSYKGNIVAIKHVLKKHVEIDRNMKKRLQLRKEMHHDNINPFIGACVEVPNIYIISQYSARQSLQDILLNEDINLDEMFVSSLISDLLKGMIYLHDSEIGCHGNLKSTNCLIDSRWVLRITDFGLFPLSQCDSTLQLDEESYSLLWTAPEIIRNSKRGPNGTQKGDVYSFGIILYEILGRRGPWGDVDLCVTEIVDYVKACEEEPFRPDTTCLKCEDYVLACIRNCWAEDADLRPDFKTSIKNRLKPLYQGLKANIFDNMLSMMETYANNLESLVAERTEQLSDEKKLTENLLLRMLPRSVADQLKLGNRVVPEMYDCVTIYFSDIVGFTELSASSGPMEIVSMLNDLYTCFDSTTEHYDVYKVETIGDAYMVVSGLPIRNNDDHAGEIASMSLHLLEKISCFQIKHRPNETLKLRIGIHSGSCVAAVVGLKMPRYCLFGDTVNTASRMESTGIALKIHCSSETGNLLNKLGGYCLEERGMINLKGKGEMLTYFLVGEDRNHRLKRLALLNVRRNIRRASSCSSCRMSRNATSTTICVDDDVSPHRDIKFPTGNLFEMTNMNSIHISDGNVSNTENTVINDPNSHSTPNELDKLLNIPTICNTNFV